MAVEIELHRVQAKILRELLFAKEARFSRLNVDNLTNDHFSFHINQLASQSLIKKTKDNTYELTNKGKQFATLIDAKENSVLKQGKVAVLIACVRKNGNEKQYLIQQRLRQPYYGFYGFIGGIVKWGESVQNAAERLLFEETGLKGELQLIGMQHSINQAEDSAILDDKYYFVFKAKNVQGDLIESPAGGKNIWMSGQEIKELAQTLRGIHITLESLKQSKLVFSETQEKERGY